LELRVRVDTKVHDGAYPSTEFTCLMRKFGNSCPFTLQVEWYQGLLPRDWSWRCVNLTSTCISRRVLGSLESCHIAAYDWKEWKWPLYLCTFTYFKAISLIIISSF